MMNISQNLRLPHYREEYVEGSNHTTSVSLNHKTFPSKNKSYLFKGYIPMLICCILLEHLVGISFVCLLDYFTGFELAIH